MQKKRASSEKAPQLVEKPLTWSSFLSLLCLVSAGSGGPWWGPLVQGPVACGGLETAGLGQLSMWVWILGSLLFLFFLLFKFFYDRKFQT